MATSMTLAGRISSDSRLQPEELSDAPEYLQQLASRFDELSNLEELWAKASNEPGARLPCQMTADLNIILDGWKQVSAAYTDLLFGNNTYNMMYCSIPYGGLWKHFFAFETALKMVTDIMKLSIFSLYFVMDSPSYNAEMRINTGRIHELLRVQERIIERDGNAILQVEDIEGFNTLSIRRYVSRTNRFLQSDPKDRWDFNVHVAFIDDMSNTQSDEERNAMDTLKDRMVSRVEDFKGHNPATFGSLLLHDTLEGSHGVKVNDTLKPFDCYLFENVFIACKVAVPKHGSLNSNAEDPVLKLRGRIFFTSILKIDRHVSHSKTSLLITYEAIGGVCPLSMCSMSCQTAAIADRWYHAILRQIRVIKGPSWSGEFTI